MQPQCRRTPKYRAVLLHLLLFMLVLHSVSVNAQPRLDSGHVYIADGETGLPIYEKSADFPAPIASVTKLMTAMVLLDSGADLNQRVTITAADVDRLKHSGSRLPVGAVLTRRELLRLALMSSENRAAHALARTSPLGRVRFVRAMNVKARRLGMANARFVDPTGLSPANQAAAVDLSKLVAAAREYPLISQFSTWPSAQVKVAGNELAYKNSNPVIHRRGWRVEVQKTGFIREAGRVVVMLFEVSGKKLNVVLMGAKSAVARTKDLLRIRKWASRSLRREFLVMTKPRVKGKIRPIARIRSKLEFSSKRRPVRR